MKKIILFLILLQTFFFAQSQLDSLSKLDYEVSLNDVWGYVDKFGYEYALVGLYNGLSIVEVTNPESPVEVFRSFGPETVWRDIKVFGDYAYVSNEAENGIRIYDLSGLPGSYQIPYKEFEGEQGKKFETAHNLFIDEKGRAFVVGTNREEGMIIYDLTEDPWNPKEIGFYNEEYIHDIYVRNDTAYAALINKGDFYILDVTNTNDIQLVSSHSTKDLQTHNTGISIDGNYLFTTDEVNGAELGVYDIQDKRNPEKVEFFKSRLLGDEMPHNVLIKDSIAFISYYTDGLIVLDVSNPENVVEVDRFDTDREGSGPGSSGAWGVYPFLPSGNILVSDIENGLFVLDYSMRNAAYVEGMVKDKETGFPLNAVTVKVLDDGKVDKTYFDGLYKIGKMSSGELRGEFSLNGYKTEFLSFQVEENKIHFEDVFLEKLDVINFVMNLTLSNGYSPDGASVFIYGDNYEEEMFFDSSGVLVKELPVGNYDFYFGKWGYANYCHTSNIELITDTLFVELVEEFYDDFSANQGWELFSEKDNSIWERAQPAASYNSYTGSQHDPSEDATIDDCDDWAYCTGINENFSASSTTVNWTNFLVSPEIKISSPNSEATISFSYWLGLSEYSNDTIKIGLIQELDTVYVKNYTSSDYLLEWKEASFQTKGLINNSYPFKFIVRVTDDLNPWNMVDFAIDEFSISWVNSVEKKYLDCVEPIKNGWSINCDSKAFVIINSVGQVVKIGNNDSFDLTGFDSGVYILKVEGNIPTKIYWNEEKW